MLREQDMNQLPTGLQAFRSYSHGHAGAHTSQQLNEIKTGQVTNNLF
jgi:hypothetical protein